MQINMDPPSVNEAKSATDDTKSGETGGKVIAETLVEIFFFFLYQCRAAFFSRIDALLGGLEWEVESTTVTHSSADWWELLLWRSHQIEGTNGFYCLIRKTLAKRGKRNCQSSEEKSFYGSGTRTIDRPVAGRHPNPLGHRSPLFEVCRTAKYRMHELHKPEISLGLQIIRTFSRVILNRISTGSAQHDENNGHT